jgi:hypothetical protein
MNLIFKIIEYLEGTDQIIIKFCRQNAPKPIDEYPAVAIDCFNIDLSDYHQFVSSIMRIGVDIILRQESEEITLPENVSSELIEIPDIKTQLNRIISLNSMQLMETTYRMNKIKLD